MFYRVFFHIMEERQEKIMGVNYFTKEQMEELTSNPYVQKVSSKAITYTTEFREEFYERYSHGELPSAILTSMRFDTRILGQSRIDNIVRRCKTMMRRGSFEDARDGASGRPRTKEMTPEEEIAYLKHKVEYQKQQIEALKKIQFVEKKKIWKLQKKNIES